MEDPSIETTRMSQLSEKGRVMNRDVCLVRFIWEYSWVITAKIFCPYYFIPVQDAFGRDFLSWKYTGKQSKVF